MSNLGIGPYRLVDFFALILPSEANQGRNNFHLAPKDLESGCGTCANCGHAIINNYIIKNSEGNRFPVGSECVETINKDGKFENMSAFEMHQKQMKRKQGQERREKQRLLLKKECEDLFKNNESILHGFTYPNYTSAHVYCLNYLKNKRTLNAYKFFKKKLIDWGCK